MESLFSREFVPSKIVLACFVPKGTGTAIHRNRPSHGFALCKDGNPVYHFDDGTILHSQAGSVIYLPKHSNYQVKSSAASCSYAINFDFTEDCAYAINFDFTEDRFHAPILFSLQDSSVFKHFRTAEQAWRKRNPGYQEQCFSSLYAIAAVLREELNRNYVPNSRTAAIQPAVDHINAHYGDPSLSVSGLSQLCGISPQYLRRLFHDVLGVSPIEYVRQLRLSRAAELIDSRLYAIHDAAALSGFLDDSYFSREFRKAYGISPTQYKSRTVD